MGRICLVCIMSVMGCSDPKGGPSKEAVRNLAEELGEATMAGDYAKIVDRTHPAAVTEFGGRDAAIAGLAAAMKQLKEAGFALTEFEVGEPGDFHTRGGNTFVVVPTALVMTSPKGKLRNPSYLLGISPDGGETWTFLDGAGLRKAEFKGKVLPELPAGFELPAPEPPEAIRGQ